MKKRLFLSFSPSLFCFPAPRVSGEGYRRGSKRIMKSREGRRKEIPQQEKQWITRKILPKESTVKKEYCCDKHWESSFFNLVSLYADTLLENDTKIATSPLFSWRIWFIAGPWKFHFCIFCTNSLSCYPLFWGQYS